MGLSQNASKVSFPAEAGIYNILYLLKLQIPAFARMTKGWCHSRAPCHPRAPCCHPLPLVVILVPLVVILANAGIYNTKWAEGNPSFKE